MIVQSRTAPASVVAPADGAAGEQQRSDHCRAAECAGTNFTAREAEIDIGDMADDERRHRGQHHRIQKKRFPGELVHRSNIAGSWQCGKQESPRSASLNDGLEIVRDDAISTVMEPTSP